MSHDKRWTGGIANREWQRGTQAGPVTDLEAVKAHVLRYLADCRRFASKLCADDHPTEDGVLKIVYWHGDAQKQAVLSVYRQLTRTRAKTPARGQDSAS